MAMGETAREYFERTKLIVHGAPDSMLERRERWYALVIDDTPFGEHDASEPHFEERAALAMILVSCGVDREISHIRRVEERQDAHTADFEAELNDGRIVRIEVTQFNDQDALTYQNHWNAVFDIVQERRRADANLSKHLVGLGVVFDIPNASLPYSIKQEAAGEILSVLTELDPSAVLRNSVVVPDKYPILHHCGARYCIADRAAPETSVKFTLPLGLSDVDRILDSVPVQLAKKAAKYGGYSDAGKVPVWLAVFARDEASGFNLPAIQEMMSNAKSIEVEPFERLMVANMVAGLLVDADRSRPAVYQSLTVSRREVPRG
jgi:hypothetical protein